ncbi:MAG TPA: FecR domain-containing protein, partial [Gammaproteobacteria bacterium]|nr:FecR domain-containing protein [Gammaproteobacteria bacterium]
MAEIVNFPDPRNDRAEAEAWLVKLDGDEFSAADAEALRKWLRAKPEHKRAIVEAMALWGDLDILSDLREMFPLTAQRAHTRPMGLALFFRPSIMATVAVLFLISGVLLWDRLHMPQDTPASAAETVLRTTVGQQGRYDLADGSHVILNTDSLLETEFTADRRDLRLVKGEAHFQVAHDPQRPFLVHAGAGVVRAVGTAFSVHLEGDEVEVSVTEGRVLVTAAGDRL